MLRTELADEQGTRDLATVLADCRPPGLLMLALHGHLGAGKTTLVRYLLGQLGHKGKVVSPTYTLVEEYILDPGRAVHMDLYRLAEPEELYYLGLEDMLQEDVLLLVEWPERGKGFLPATDLEITLESIHQDARRVTLQALTETAKSWLNCVEEKLTK